MLPVGVRDQERAPKSIGVPPIEQRNVGREGKTAVSIGDRAGAPSDPEDFFDDDVRLERLGYPQTSSADPTIRT